MPPSSNASVFSQSSMATTRTVINDKLAGLLIQPENHRCADCSDLRPSWASLIKPPVGAPPESPTIGLFCCLFCSAAHRKLGDDICTVKSVKLDQWEDEEILAMERGGNLRVNAIFEGALFDDTEKPSPLVDAAVREQYVREKYLNLKYFVEKAYSCVGTEDEDEDDDIVDDDEHTAVNILATFSQSTNFTKRTLPSIAEGPPRLATLLMTPQISRPSLGKIPRQSSMPDMKYCTGAGLTTPTSNKVSDALALKKIASPFRGNKDFWESMNNSQWGDLTFEDSLHRKSGINLANGIRRSSWNLSDDESLPKCPEKDTKNLKQRGGRRRGMPKKAVSEPTISTSSKDLLPLTQATSKVGIRNKVDRSALMSRPKCVSDPALLSSRSKPGRNHSLGSPKRSSKSKPGRNLSLGSLRQKSGREGTSSSPSSEVNRKTFPVLDLLEETNRNRKLSHEKPNRHISEPAQQLKVQCPPRQKSVPSASVRKAQSLRDVNATMAQGGSIAENLDGISKFSTCVDQEKGRSLSPKTQRRSKSRNSKKQTSPRSSRGHKERTAEVSSSHYHHLLSLTSRGGEIARQQMASNSNFSGFSGSNGSKSSSRRSSSADAGKVMRRRNVALSSSEHIPPWTPGKRKAHKSRTPKAPLTRKASFVECSESAPTSSTLERSLSSRVKPNNRPRSLSVCRKNRLRRKNKPDDLSAATEHSSDAVFQHPLFAYPVSAITR